MYHIPYIMYHISCITFHITTYARRLRNAAFGVGILGLGGAGPSITAASATASASVSTASAELRREDSKCSAREKVDRDRDTDRDRDVGGSTVSISGLAGDMVIIHVISLVVSAIHLIISSYVSNRYSSFFVSQPLALHVYISICLSTNLFHGNIIGLIA